jgi:hypothetical protein
MRLVGESIDNAPSTTQLSENKGFFCLGGARPTRRPITVSWGCACRTAPDARLLRIAPPPLLCHQQVGIRRKLSSVRRMCGAGCRRLTKGVGFWPVTGCGEGPALHAACDAGVCSRLCIHAEAKRSRVSRCCGPLGRFRRFLARLTGTAGQNQRAQGVTVGQLRRAARSLSRCSRSDVFHVERHCAPSMFHVEHCAGTVGPICAVVSRAADPLGLASGAVADPRGIVLGRSTRAARGYTSRRTDRSCARTRRRLMCYDATRVSLG